jgi:phosphoglycerate dehydrogenase-like enzyme
MTSKLIVGCDLFMDLKLYRVPQQKIEEIENKFQRIEIYPINVKGDEKAPLEDINIYWGNRITPEIISSLPKLKWIHFGSVGVNRAQTQDVLDRNIMVTNSSGTMTAAVAAQALTFMTTLARGFHHCWRLRQEGDLTRSSYDQFFDATHELEGQTCLIVGYGQIGKKLGTICAALGMKVKTISRSAGFRLSELKEAVTLSDYVVNILPLTLETTGVFTREIFFAMKKSAFFINVGRGETVIEKDLVEALKSKTIAGAGLDVFENEPLSMNSELWDIPEAIITPHIGGLTNRYWIKECKLFEDNLKRFVSGEPLLNCVDMKTGY